MGHAMTVGVIHSRRETLAKYSPILQCTNHVLCVHHQHGPYSFMSMESYAIASLEHILGLRATLTMSLLNRPPWRTSWCGTLACRGGTPCGSRGQITRVSPLRFVWMEMWVRIYSYSPSWLLIYPEGTHVPPTMPMTIERGREGARQGGHYPAAARPRGLH